MQGIRDIDCRKIVSMLLTEIAAANRALANEFPYNKDMQFKRDYAECLEKQAVELMHNIVVPTFRCGDKVICDGRPGEVRMLRYDFDDMTYYYQVNHETLPLTSEGVHESEITHAPEKRSHVP